MMNGDADDLAAELLDELDLRLRRAAGREHVVVDQHALARATIASACSSSASKPYSSAYFALTVRHGSLPGLRAGDEAAAEPAGERAAGDEAARLGAEHEVGLARLGPRRRGRRPSRASASAVGEQRHDVLEDDPRLREVRDVADHRLRGPSTRSWRARPAARSRQKRSCESSCASSASVWRSSSPACAALGVPRAERGRDELLEQRRLAVGGRAERAQVPRRDRRTARAARTRRRCRRRSRVAPARRPRRAASSRPKSSSSRASSGVMPGALAELVEVELVLARRRARRAPALALLRAPARRAPGGSRAAAGTRRAAAAGSSRSRSTSSSLNRR